MADNGSQPMPGILRSWARDGYTVGSARLRLSVPAWRRNLVRRAVESFAPNLAPEASFGRSGRRRFAAFADLDRRFNWLDRPAPSRDVSIVHVPRDIFRPVFHVLLQRNGYKPDTALGENSMHRYYDPALTGHRERYRRYCTEVGRDLVRLYGIEGVLLPKLNDDWIIDVLIGLRRAGLPVVVQDREHGITPKRLEVYPPHFRAILDDLACERLLVSNDIQREFFRLAGYPAEFLVVTGKPDSDFWSYAPPPPPRRQIDPRLDDRRSLLLFFAFGRFNYLNFFYAGETRDWTPLGRDVHSVLLEALRRHKGRLQIVYKIGGKRVRDNFPGAELFLEEAATIDPEGIVVLDEHTSTLDLLRVSDGVLGFHTLGLVEAMFTTQPILYGAWGELFDDIKGTLMPFHQSDGLIWCDAPDRLSEQLDRLVENPAALTPTAHQAAARRQFRETWYHKPDGRTAERVLDATLEAFEDFRRRRPCHRHS